MNPRWLSLVLRAVGDCGSGESGALRGDLTGAMGDFSDKDGRAEAVATLMLSFGFMAFEASILNDRVNDFVVCLSLLFCLSVCSALSCTAKGVLMVCLMQMFFVCNYNGKRLALEIVLCN